MDPRSKNREFLKQKLKSKRKKPVLIIEENDDNEKGIETGVGVSVDTGVDIDIQHIEKDKTSIQPETQIQQKKPKKELHFFYFIRKSLNTDYEKLQSFDKDIKIHICIFQIIQSNNNDTPFLQYLFYKSRKSPSYPETMFFPFIKKGDDTLELTLKNIDDETNKIILSIVETTDIQRLGYIEENNNIYMFYDIGKKENISISQLNRNTSFWWGIIDEIVNVKNIVNFPIKDNIVNLFVKYNELCYLYSRLNNDIEDTDEITTSTDLIHKYGNIIVDIQSYTNITNIINDDLFILDTPCVGYHGTYYKIVPKIAMLGLNQSTYNAMMGPYYYFGTYRKAIRYAGWTSDYKPRTFYDFDTGKEITIGDREGRYERGGIIRFALFLGNMKAFLNHPNDPEDLSDIVKERIKEHPRNKAWEMRTIRMHDHDGKWATEQGYDSVYVGKALLENGKPFMANQEFIVKNFEQQKPLSYHYLDKSTLQENWENDYLYYYIE
jgi:hypothetical protein